MTTTGFDWGSFAAQLPFTAAAALGVLLATFAVAVRKDLHRLVDVAWGVAFCAVALVSYALSAGQGDDGRRLCVAVLTVVWGLRLSVHIARRGRGHGEDPRYEQLLSKAPGSRAAYALRMVYLLQGGLVWLVSLPVQSAMYIEGAMSPVAAVGAALWLLGIVFEAVGDRQLARFKSDPAHRGRIMDRGLWSWTRHPNYFGDFCVWWGLFLFVCDWPPAAAATVIGPLVMSYLLTRGSGKALLERHMADRPGYADYRERVSGFFPRPPRKAAGG
ncbi:DUF1295 domain-containing protein [Streptomyces mesophilus]|uniref:DUF1295 domain-containing protein n=1 Tax=Streptomyces mesophilus TaxID=1775132 RepID=UPI0033278042